MQTIPDKHPRLKYKVSLDFAPKLLAGDAPLGAPNYYPVDGDVEVTDLAISGTEVSFMISGGSAGYHNFDIVIATQSGEILPERCKLRVMP